MTVDNAVFKQLSICSLLGLACASPQTAGPSATGIQAAKPVEQQQEAAGEVVEGALYVRVTKHRAAQLILPPGWAARVQVGKPNHSLVVEGVSLDGLSRVKMSLLVPPNEELARPSVEQMNAMVKGALAPYIGRSVEGEVQLKQQKMGDGLAVYATATDKELDPNGPMSERTWLRFTMGNSVHDGFIAAVTVYSKADAAPGLAVWHSLRSIPYSPMRKLRFGPLQLELPMPEQTEWVRKPGLDSKLTSFNPSIGFNLTLHTYPIQGNVNPAEGPAAMRLLAMAAKTSAKGCQEQYRERLDAVMGKRPGVTVDPKSIQITAEGSFVRYRHVLVAQHPSQPEPVQMPNSFTFLGGEGHCTVLHLSLAPATDLNRQVMKMVEESLTVAGQGS